MKEGHPADGNEGFFSQVKKLFTGRKAEHVTEEEIMDMVNEGHEKGVLKENEAEMIGNIFEFGEKQAHDVMTHRKNIVAIDCNATVQEAFDFILNESFSRYPVYCEDIDNIIGVIHIRDLLKVYVDENMRNKTLQEIQDDVLFDSYCIPETRNISILFKEMQEEKVHMAIVVDEYGQTAGIVTMEDILEEIVGNILDEYDEEEQFIIREADGTYLIDGQTSLEDIEDMLEIKFECEDIDTINGYLLYKLGKIPEENEQFETECGGYVFQIVKVEDRMIRQVRVRKVMPDKIQ